ncbi:hypothetical protein GJAV_G00202390 [Gymnothorax javanicus]|nr:hypothetical protein GJAV_G00202390 [Gymnothorax javanicus]
MRTASIRALVFPDFIYSSLEEGAIACPWMQPFLEALDLTINFTLQNSLQQDNFSAPPNYMGQAFQIFLTGLNWTDDSLHQLTSGAVFFSTDSKFINKVLKDTVMEVIRLKILGDWPEAYQFMMQLLGENTTALVLEKAFELSAWWSSTETSGMEFLWEAMEQICSTVKVILSALMEMNVPLSSESDIFFDTVGDTIYMLWEMVNMGDIFAPLADFIGQLKEQVGFLLKTPSTKRVKRMADRPLMEDFLDLLEIDYPALLKALSVPPTMEDIMETVHVFFANPDLATVLKGLSVEFTGDSSESETIDTFLRVLSFITVSGQWERYFDVFTQIAREGWDPDDFGKMEKLMESTSTLIDVAMVLSRKPSLDIAQNVEHMIQELSPIVSKIINNQMGNHTDTAVQFLTAVNGILNKNLEVPNNIDDLISGIVYNLQTSISRPESQTSLAPYMMALDQSVAAFASFLPPENLKCINSSAQMIKGIAGLLYCPKDKEKLLGSVSLITSSLNYYLMAAGKAKPPAGESFQNISYYLILNSALATEALWNLSTSNMTFESSEEKAQAVAQVMEHLVHGLPEEQRKYVLPLQTPLLNGLRGISSSAEIPHHFFNISREITVSLLIMLNITESPEDLSMSTDGFVLSLFNVSDLVSRSLWTGLSQDPSMDQLPAVLQSLRQAVVILNPMLPPQNRHYLKASFLILETMASTFNHTDVDIGIASSTIAASVRSLLAMAPHPELQATEIIIGDFEQTLQRVLVITSSDLDPMDRIIGISQELLKCSYNMLTRTTNDTEAQMAQIAIGAVKMNMGHLLTLNSTNWVNKLPLMLADIGDRIPAGLPFAYLFKNLFSESQDALLHLALIGQTASEIIMTDWMSDQYIPRLDKLMIQVCQLERMSSVQDLYRVLSVPTGFLCEMGLPSVEAVHMVSASLLRDGGSGLKAFTDALFETIVGDPSKYHLNTNWTTALSNNLGFNVTSLTFLNTSSVKAPGQVNVADLLKNKTAFVEDVRHLTGIPAEVLNHLLDIVLPDDNLKLLAWLTTMRHCDNSSSLALNRTEEQIFKTFCSLSSTRVVQLLGVGDSLRQCGECHLQGGAVH